MAVCMALLLLTEHLEHAIGYQKTTDDVDHAFLRKGTEDRRHVLRRIVVLPYLVGETGVRMGADRTFDIFTKISQAILDRLP